MINGVALKESLFSILANSDPRVTKMFIQVAVLRKILIYQSIQKNYKNKHSSYPEFPRARAFQYSQERKQAYLLCSERVQELPCRYGRHNQPVKWIKGCE